MWIVHCGGHTVSYIMRFTLNFKQINNVITNNRRVKVVSHTVLLLVLVRRLNWEPPERVDNLSREE